MKMVAKKTEPPVFPPFNPFVRHPTSFVGKIRMLVFGSVLVPIRLFGAICTLASCLIWCKFCLSIGGGDSCGNNNKNGTTKPYTRLQTYLMGKGCGIFSRILLFWYGFIWIDVTYEIDDPIVRPSIIVVNHLGFAELLYLVWSDGCCFVSKDTNRQLPFIGTIAECLQSIFVDRAPEQENGTIKSTTDRILERANSPVGTYPSLCMCPEGTTHTGHCLLQFSTGAFRSGTAIKPVVVQSPFSPVSGYDTSFSCTDIVLHIIFLMTQPINRLQVKHLPVYVPNNAEKSNPRLYANNVRQKMADALGVKCYELTWTDKLRYEPTKKARDLGQKKLVERYGFLPPPPIFHQDAFGNPLLNSTKRE